MKRKVVAAVLTMAMAGSCWQDAEALLPMTLLPRVKLQQQMKAHLPMTVIPQTAHAEISAAYPSPC